MYGREVVQVFIKILIFSFGFARRTGFFPDYTYIFCNYCIEVVTWMSFGFKSKRSIRKRKMIFF